MRSQTSPSETIQPEGSAKMLRAMVGIGIFCALMIVLTFEGTLPRIEKNKAEALEKAIFQVLPQAVSKQTFQLKDKSISVVNEGTSDKEVTLLHAGYDDNGELIGVAVEASGLGFADVIRILYGYDPEKQVINGFHVLESKETPGLGDKIEKDADFLANFDALDSSLKEDHQSLKNAIEPVKKGAKTNPWEIEGITGATISSRAIGNIIGFSADRWVPVIYQNQSQLTLKKSIDQEN